MSETPHGEQRKIAILKSGLQLWRVGGAENVTARRVGQSLGLTHAGVLYHHGSTEALRKAIAEYAVRMGDPVVVPQLITSKHPVVAKMDPDAKRQFLANVPIQG